MLLIKVRRSLVKMKYAIRRTVILKVWLVMICGFNMSI